jgi:hypothetical protein
MGKSKSRVEKAALALLPSSDALSQLTFTDDVQRYWAIECAWERNAREQLLTADGSRAEKREHARVWWYVLESILRDYLNYDSPKYPFRIPHDLAEVLRDIAGCLATGKIPEDIAAVQGRGIPSRSPQEHEQIEIAQMYVEAATDGRIVDKNPVKTVAETYGVHRRTARKWANETEVRSEVFYEFDAEELVRRMREAGAAYAKTGRSAAAIRERGRPAPK